jgi:hypothetical protein
MSLLAGIFFLIVALAIFWALRECFLAKHHRESVPPGFSGGLDEEWYRGILNTGLSGGESQNPGAGDHCSAHQPGCDTGGHHSFDGGHH